MYIYILGRGRGRGRGGGGGLRYWVRFLYIQGRIKGGGWYDAEGGFYM